MPLITWTSAFSVGVAHIDEQHQKLVKLINDLHDAMRSGNGSGVVGPVLSSLIDYTVYHFSTEEQLFLKTRYPGAKEHVIEHKALTQEVLNIKAKFDAGEPVITIDLMDFLRRWLSDHIKGMDKRYTAYFHSKGIQ
jgi:hemerythrin